MVTHQGIRVLVVDDDPAVRSTLSAILATDPTLRVIAEAHDGRDALTRVANNPVEVMLLDIRMPGLDGLQTLDLLRQTSNTVRVLMLTTFGESDYVRRAISSGADGFLLKSGHPADLIRAVHGTLAGETWLSPAVARYLAADARTLATGRREAVRATALLNSLSSREQQVARAVARGLTNAEVGTALHLSESTVKAYLSTALCRLALRNRVELASLVWLADPGAAEVP